MRLKLIFISFFTLLLTSSMLAQSGFIRGSVFDAEFGEYLPGVTVLVEGTTTGTITDLDGKFSITLAPGTYNLRVSFISYETVTIQDIEVKDGEATVLDVISLKEASFELAEVTVTAKAVRDTETALLTIKKKSANVLDGISSANFRKIGDSDAASSMKRVPGVSVEGGKYVFVRGLGDRYTKTTLNGVEIPGLDPDRNTIQMDLFPTNIIDNIIVNKSFSAELPADFTGGVVDINTKDFPEEKMGRLSFTLGYNPSMHFNSNYLTYNGGKTDWLGFDDGTRDIPATENVPFFSEVVGDPYGEEGQRYREILEGFNPNMGAFQKNSLMDMGLSVSFGNQFAKEKATLGYNVALSYKNETEYYKDAEFGRYGLSGDPDVYEMEVREHQLGDYGVNNVLLSGMAGFAIKTSKSKYRINLMHLQSGESQAGIFDYKGSDQGSVFDAMQHNLDYSQRSLTNMLLAGNHRFNNSKWDLEWKVSPSLAKNDDPDVRFTRYEDRDGEWAIGTEVGFPERIWRELNEINIASLVHVTKDYENWGNKSKLKFGGGYTFKERDYEILSYALNIRGIPLTGDPDELFWEENLWPYNDDPKYGTTYEARFVPYNANQYNSTVNNITAYVSTELSISPKVKTILGLRLENYVQRYTGSDQLQDNILDNDVVLEDFDLFPSINFVYSLNDKQNLRLSYSKTIARPSFKELSYSEIYDPITGRTFVGGLFQDFDPNTGVIFWDGNLVSTNIHNYDLRWEYFGTNGQTFSLSGFYKNFIKPIEIVQYATQVGAFQPRNVGDGDVFGIEAEMRLNMETIIKPMKSYRFVMNVTVNESQIKLSKTEYDSRVEHARTGQTIDNYRNMAGLAPYIINAGFAYDGGKKGFSQGLEAGLYYYVQGQTLQYVGIVDRPDIYTKPFHSLNFNANKRFGKDQKMTIGLKIENILGSKKEWVYQSFEAADQYFERLDPGTKISIKFTYSLY